MANLTEITQGLTKRVIVYGPGKTGKTQLVSTLAHRHKLLWIDLEAGSDVLFKLPHEAQKNIELIRIRDTTSDPVAIDTVSRLLKGYVGPICVAHGKIRCVSCLKRADEPGVMDEINMGELRKTNNAILVIDSLTQLRVSAMTHISKGRGDNYKFEFDDWAALNNAISSNLIEIQAAPYDVVVISHEDMVKSVDGSEKIVPISATRNASRNTVKYFSDVVYCDIVNGKHVAASSTTYQNRIQTGSRSDVKLETAKELSLFPFFEHREPVSNIPLLKS